MTPLAEITRALAIDQLSGTADPDAVDYWLEEYVRERELPLREAHLVALERAQAEIARLELENATLRLGITVARTQLEAVPDRTRTRRYSERIRPGSARRA